MLLTDATEIAYGAASAQRVYLGPTLLWPPGSGPLDIAATAAWWRADHSGSFDLDGNNKVINWRDQVTGHVLNQATEANRPTYGAASFEGTPGVTFDAAAQTYLTLASSPWPVNALSSMMIVVCDQLTPSSDTSITTLAAYGDTDLAQRKLQRIVAFGSNRAALEIGNTWSVDTFYNPREDYFGPHSVVCWYGDVSSTCNIDDAVFSGVSSFALRTATGRTRVGANAAATPGEFASAIIRDVIIVDAALLTADDFQTYVDWAFGRVTP